MRGKSANSDSRALSVEAGALVVCLLCAIGAGVCHADETSADPNRPTATAPAASRPSLFDPDPNQPLGLQTRSPDTDPGYLSQMLAIIVIILVLGAAAVFVTRKLLPRIAKTAGRNITVIETVYLGPKKTVQLLQVGTRKYLAAGSRDSTSVLTDVTNAFDEGPAQEDTET